MSFEWLPPTSDAYRRCRNAGTWDVLSVLRPSVEALPGDAASEPRRRLAGRRGLSRPGTTRSRRCRFLVPSSSCPDGVSYPDPRDAFAIATASPRTPRRPPSGFALGIETVLVRSLRKLWDASFTAHGQNALPMSCAEKYLDLVANAPKQLFLNHQLVHLARPVSIRGALAGRLQNILRTIHGTATTR
jgi:hypothetical protein